ncbi:MAG: DUF4432 family protein [Ruminococcaceae bacterium]|nr:DUF4432 family protein [Oscillospiraceae bacterium]
MNKKYYGSRAQYLDVRQYTLTDGRARGMRAIDVWNGGNLHFTILPDRCMDIFTTRYKGNNITYLTYQGMVAPQMVNDQGWVRAFGGGLFATCGLKNIGGIPEEDKSNPDVTLNGRIGQMPAENVCVEFFDNDTAVRIRGTMRESMLYGSDYTLTRTIEVRHGEDTIRFTDEVTNHAYKAHPVSMLYHFNMGYPFMDEKAKVILPTGKIIAGNDRGEEDMKTYDRFSAVEDDYPQILFWHELKEKWFAFENETLNARLRVSYESPILDCFQQWKVCEAGTYVSGLEPCSQMGGRSDAIANGTQKYLNAGETIENRFEIAFSEMK